MPVYTQQEFGKDFEQAQSLNQALYGQSHHTQTRRTTSAWNLYKNASEPALGFHLFGRRIASKDVTAFRSQSGNAQATLPGALVGLSYPEKCWANFKTVSDEGGKKGSLLDMTAWSLTVNDSWVLGGIHAGLPFHAASPLTKANLLDASHVLTVTGRELLAMSIYGYKVRQGHAALEMVMVCTDRARARGGSLVEIQASVAGCTKAAHVLEYYAKAGLKL